MLTKPVLILCYQVTVLQTPLMVQARRFSDVVNRLFQISCGQTQQMKGVFAQIKIFAIIPKMNSCQHNFCSASSSYLFTPQPSLIWRNRNTRSTSIRNLTIRQKPLQPSCIFKKAALEAVGESLKV